MPKWSGRWAGGRFYLDELERPVYYIERRAAGASRVIRVKGHDEAAALAELGLFLTDRDRYWELCKPRVKGPLRGVRDQP